MILNPEETIKALLLRDDSRIADFGAGSGIFSLAAAKRAPSGKVYAVDIQREMLPLIARKADDHGHENIEIIWGDVEEKGGSKLKDSYVDVVILANMLFQAKDKNAVVSEISRILKKGGKVLFVDWEGSFGHIGPREEDVVSRRSALELFEKEGFVFLQEVPAGDYHYGMILIGDK